MKPSYHATFGVFFGIALASSDVGAPAQEGGDEAAAPTSPVEAAVEPDEAEKPEKTEPAAPIDALIEQLSSDDFREREDAMLQIWKIGEAAEEQVRELTKSRDIELRTRAARLLGLFKYGIYPDTPPDVVALINEFRHGDTNTKTNVVTRLYSQGATETVTKLIRSVEHPQLRSKLVNAVVAEVDFKVAGLYSEGKYDAAEQLLSLAAISGEGLRRIAAFHFHRGTIDAKIAELLERDKEAELPEMEYEQLSWYYRFKGDFEHALVAAEASGNEELQRNVRIAQGDLLALIKASYNPNDRTIQAFGYNAAHQRLSGDLEEFERTVQTIRKYAKEHPDEELYCLEALVINGRIPDALEIASEGTEHRLQLLIDSGRHAEALAELGIDNPKPPYEKWLDEVVAQFKRAETREELGDPLGRAFKLGQILTDLGEKDEAARIFDRLGAVASQEKPELIQTITSNASLFGLYDVALKYTRAAFVREAEEAGAEPDPEERVRNRFGQRGAETSLVTALFYSDVENALFWWDRIAERFNNDSGLERLDKLDLLLGRPAEKTAARLSLLEQLAPQGDEDMADADLGMLLSELALLYLHMEEPTPAGLLAQALDLEPEECSEELDELGAILATRDDWEGALPLFELAANGAAIDPFIVARYGIALERNGRHEEAAAALKRAHHLALGQPIGYWHVARAFASFLEFDRAREAFQLALNIDLFDDPRTYRMCVSLSSYLFYSDPAKSAIYKERYLLEHLKGHIRFIDDRISIGASTRGSIGALQAQVAIEDDRAGEAVVLMRDLVAQQPSNSSLLEDVYPLLVKAGHKKEADELYEKLNEYGENAIALFPNSAQDLNSNAWLKSRCGKDLETALERSRRSNELLKDNPAYLDTLAEVYFQMGDRKKAIEHSERAVGLSGSDYLLHHQLEHFKNDEPLSTTLAE